MTKDEIQKVTLGTNEALRVTSDGEFIWHPEADAMIEEGDFTSSPAMRHILRALRKALAARQEHEPENEPFVSLVSVQEPVVWKWHQAPVKTQWGDDMVVADLAIGKDHTVSVYCERDQTAKVEAMFNSPAAQRPWVGLTDDEVRKINQEVWGYVSADHTRMRGYAHAIEAKLKEKNNG
jgi:hypothetical protein